MFIPDVQLQSTKISFEKGKTSDGRHRLPGSPVETLAPGSIG